MTSKRTPKLIEPIIERLWVKNPGIPESYDVGSSQPVTCHHCYPWFLTLQPSLSFFALAGSVLPPDLLAGVAVELGAPGPLRLELPPPTHLSTQSLTSCRSGLPGSNPRFFFEENQFYHKCWTHLKPKPMNCKPCLAVGIANDM